MFGPVLVGVTNKFFLKSLTDFWSETPPWDGGVTQFSKFCGASNANFLVFRRHLGVSSAFVLLNIFVFESGFATFATRERHEKTTGVGKRQKRGKKKRQRPRGRILLYCKKRNIPRKGKGPDKRD